MLRERFPDGRYLAGYLHSGDHLRSASFGSSLLLCAVKVFDCLFYGFLDNHALYSVKQRAPALASLKSSSCLNKFTQTWREKQANHSDFLRFLGKLLRHGEIIRRKWKQTQAGQTQAESPPNAKTLPREDAQEGLQVGLSRMLRA